MYWLLENTRTEGFEGSLQAFRYVNQVCLPSIKCSTCNQTWSKFNIRYQVHKKSLVEIKALLKGFHFIVGEEEFKEVKIKIEKIIPKLPIFPGLTFGVPEIKLREQVKIHFKNEVVTEDFKKAYENAGLNGLKFFKINSGKSKPYLYCIEAEVTSLIDPLEEECSVCGKKQLRDIYSEKIVLDKEFDIMRLPHDYGGYIFSDNAKKVVEGAGLETCIDFQKVKTAFYPKSISP